MTPNLSAPTPKVKRVVDFKIDMSHSDVDVALLICIEPRFWSFIGDNEISTVTALLKAKGWKKFAPLTEAGGIKLLVSEKPEDQVRREAFLARVEEEVVELHHPKVLALTVHRDCGGYGYSKSFANADEEDARLYEDLFKAYRTMSDRFGSKTKIEIYVFDGDGVHEVEF